MVGGWLNGPMRSTVLRRHEIDSDVRTRVCMYVCARATTVILLLCAIKRTYI